MPSRDRVRGTQTRLSFALQGGGRRSQIIQKSTSKSAKKLFPQIFKRFSKDFLLEEQSKHIDTLRVEIIQKSTSKSAKKLFPQIFKRFSTDLLPWGSIQFQTFMHGITDVFRTFIPSIIPELPTVVFLVSEDAGLIAGQGIEIAFGGLY